MIAFCQNQSRCTFIKVKNVRAKKYIGVKLWKQAKAKQFTSTFYNPDKTILCTQKANGEDLMEC